MLSKLLPDGISESETCSWDGSPWHRRKHVLKLFSRVYVKNMVIVLTCRILCKLIRDLLVWFETISIHAADFSTPLTSINFKNLRFYCRLSLCLSRSSTLGFSICFTFILIIVCIFPLIFFMILSKIRVIFNTYSKV